METDYAQQQTLGFPRAIVNDTGNSAADVDSLLAELSKTRTDSTFREITDVFENQSDTKFGVGLNETTSTLKHLLFKALVLGSDPLESSHNVLLRLISRDQGNKYHIKLAFQILRVMVKTHQWDRYLSMTLDVSRPAHDADDRGNGLLHEAAKTGHCKLLEPFLEKHHVSMQNAKGETPLHLAAEYGHSDDVEILLNKGAELTTDQEGCTPLHSAALSMEPNNDVARLLVKASAPASILNARHHKTEDTALHCAARNCNVTAEFIEELRSMDPLMRNKVRETAFHVAAKSDNPETFMAMMSTFAPTKCGWDVDDADYDSDLVSSTKETLKPVNSPAGNLLDICARNGNVQAVASLIQNGADLSKGIFHTIIEESVRKPDKIDELKAVYHAITENVVFWHYLEKNAKCPVKHSDKYKECLRIELERLTTDPPEGHHSKMGAIDYAISLGAGDLLMEILNTRDVYKFDEFGQPHHYIRKKQSVFSRYDVTNFISAKMSDYAANAKRQPYLSQIVDNGHKWRQTDILKQEPFKTLTEPFIRFTQLLYLLLAIVQLLYMVWCTEISMLQDGYKQMYNFSDKCSNNSQQSNEDHNDTGTGQSTDNMNSGTGMSSLISLYVVWPTVLLVSTSVHFVWFCVAQLSKSRKADGNQSEEQEALLSKILFALAEKIGLIVFCVAVLFEVVLYYHGCDRNYLLALSMSHLFGWLTTLSFFSGITKEFHVFSLLLRDVIIKDILFRFVLVFTFTITAFSFALHVLRQTVPDSTDILRESVFETFVSSFGLGDKILTDTKNGSTEMKIVFAVYICVMMVILLNVLIAMVNTRYEDAMERAENEWRFEVVSAAIRLHDIPCFRRFVRIEESVICCRHFCCPKHSRIYVDPESQMEDRHETLIAVKQDTKTLKYGNRYFMDVKRAVCRT